MARHRQVEVWRSKDGRAWRIGRDPEVAWIEENTTSTMGITSAIPPVFDAYATVQLPVTPDGEGGWVWNEPPDRHDASVLGVLSENTAPQPWWLGYLETGGAETVFYDVPMTRVYGWEYVLIEAGPEQAGSWRAAWGRWKGVLPDLMFPADRSWLASMLWDDYWTSIGGSRGLVEAFLAHPDLRRHAREVDPSAADVTPPATTTT